MAKLPFVKTNGQVASGTACALHELLPGQIGRLTEPGTGVSRRLLDLGFVAGTPIRVVRRGPLGGPLEVELRGYRLALRGSDAAGLWVTLDEPETP